jgi:hypothetical protein
VTCWLAARGIVRPHDPGRIWPDGQAVFTITSNEPMCYSRGRACTNERPGGRPLASRPALPAIYGTNDAKMSVGFVLEMVWV